MRLHTSKCFVVSFAEATALLAFTQEGTQTHKLGGAWFYPKKGHVFASNGHRIAQLNPIGKGARGHDEEPFLVPRDVLKSTLAACRKTDFLRIFRTKIEIHTAESYAIGSAPPRMSIAYTEAKEERVDFEGLIPPIRRRETVAAIGLNARYLSELSLVHDALPKDTPTILYMPATMLDPVMVIAGAWTVVIMPVRFDDAFDIFAGAQAQ